MTGKKNESVLRETFALAIKEVGLTENEFLELANKNGRAKYIQERFYEELEIKTALKLVNILCLEVWMLQYGYRKNVHRKSVATAIQNNTYKLPINDEAKNIYNEFILSIPMV